MVLDEQQQAPPLPRSSLRSDERVVVQPRPPGGRSPESSSSSDSDGDLPPPSTTRPPAPLVPSSRGALLRPPQSEEWRLQQLQQHGGVEATTPLNAKKIFDGSPERPVLQRRSGPKPPWPWNIFLFAGEEEWGEGEWGDWWGEGEWGDWGESTAWQAREAPTGKFYKSILHSSE